jgi:hypothetical protein
VMSADPPLALVIAPPLLVCDSCRCVGHHCCGMHHWGVALARMCVCPCARPPDPALERQLGSIATLRRRGAHTSPLARRKRQLVSLPCPARAGAALAVAIRAVHDIYIALRWLWSSRRNVTFSQGVYLRARYRAACASDVCA